MDSSIVEFLIMVAVIVAPMILKNLFKGGVDADDIFYPPEKKPHSQPKGSAAGSRHAPNSKRGSGSPFMRMSTPGEWDKRKVDREAYAKSFEQKRLKRSSPEAPKPIASPFGLDQPKPVFEDLSDMTDSLHAENLKSADIAEKVSLIYEALSKKNEADAHGGGLFGNLNGAEPIDVCGTSSDAMGQTGRVRESVLDILKSPDGLKAAFVASEILGAPIALRGDILTRTQN